jgi:hypothetical protein
MKCIDSFNVGDIVAFKNEEENLPNASRFCVIDKTADKVVVSRIENIRLEYPSDLLTSKEIEEIRKPKMPSK